MAAEEGAGLVVFLQKYGQAAVVASVAGELAGELPEEHDYQSKFLSVEADALLQLGLTSEALAKMQRVNRSREKRAVERPDRTDYQYEVGASYDRMGDLLRGLGEETRARSYYERALEIVERLARREPDRTDRSIARPFGVL